MSKQIQNLIILKAQICPLVFGIQTLEFSIPAGDYARIPLIGVLPSIDSHSKHSIVHGKLNFKFPSPPPSKVDLICDQRDNVNWNDLFHNLNVNEMCLLFTDVFWGVMSTNISNKTITCNDKDAPWITTSRKTAIKCNSRVYRNWIQRGRNPTEHQNVRDV